jgi:hypothetical protein
MKSSPMILAMLCAAALVWGSEPTPTPAPTPPPSSLAPLDGSTFSVGDQVLFESAGEFACPFATARYIENTDLAIVLGSKDSANETISFRVPGQYIVERVCAHDSLSFSLTRNHFTVLPACQLDNHPAEASTRTSEVPAISVSQYSNVINARQVITLDNSFNRMPALEIANEGDGDLVVIDIVPFCQFDTFAVSLDAPCQYVVVRPGHKYYLPISAVVIKPESLGTLKRNKYTLGVYSNDPANPVVFLRFVL